MRVGRSVPGIAVLIACSMLAVVARPPVGLSSDIERVAVLAAEPQPRLRGKPVLKNSGFCTGETQGTWPRSNLHKARCSLLPPGETTTPGTTSGSTPDGTGTSGSGTSGSGASGTSTSTPPGTGTSAGATPPAGTGTSPPGTTPPATDKPGFAYYPPGELVQQDKDRGRRNDRKVYAPNIIFPLKLGDGKYPHMNSQIYGYGGGGWNGKGAAGGSESDPRNYDPLKQQDDYCEVRGWQMPLCPAGVGHQGQDIRPPSFKDNYWEVVAVADGVVVNVTSNTTVDVKGTDGTNYLYLHMHPASIKVKTGQTVKQGEVIGRVSNYMSGQRGGTTVHLHFQMRQNIKKGNEILRVYVPLYTSLVASLRRDKGLDPGIDGNGNLIADPAVEIGATGAPVPVPAPTPTPPAPQPAPVPAPEPTPAPPAPPPAPTPSPPAPEPVPVPAPAPTPAPPPPAPAPQPAPAPAPQQPSWWQKSWDSVKGWWDKRNAPAQQPAPAPAPTPAPQPAPPPAAPPPASEPAPSPEHPDQQSWWQKARDTISGWWNKPSK